MAIRGIDNQIMITKSTEVAVDRARMQKGQEGVVTQAAQQVQQEAEQAQSRTMAVTQTEQEAIRPDQEGEGAQGGASGEGRQKEETPEQTEKKVDPLLLLPVERGKYARAKEHKIDIIV